MKLLFPKNLKKFYAGADKCKSANIYFFKVNNRNTRER